MRSGVRPRTAILEAEIVAVVPESGDLRPFQELMHRRRRYGVAEAMQRYPVGLFVFDLLSVGGKDLTTYPYAERRAGAGSRHRAFVSLRPRDRAADFRPA